MTIETKTKSDRVTLRADEFKALQKKTGMSNAETSRVLMISHTTILKWRKNGGDIPSAVVRELSRRAV